jgi:beta-lactamase regulating signal transducer with metallopeptidase domain/uncharacterized membrane protein
MARTVREPAMDFLVQAALSNAVIVAILAPIVLAVDRFFRRPALVHRLWLLLLIKLVTPPLWPIPVGWPVGSPALAPTGSVASGAEQTSDAVAAGAAARRTGESRGVPGGAGVSAGFRAVDLRARLNNADPPRLADSRRDVSRPLAGVVSRAWDGAWDITLRWEPSLASAWLVVSGIWLVWTADQLIRMRRRLGAVRPAHPHIQEMADEIARKLDLKHAPLVLLVQESMSPALWALGLRPRILVPEALWARLDKGQQVALLAHELAHLRRRDHWIRPLELLATSVYWWFPVLWWTRRSLREAEEECCDAWVVSLMPESKRAYARALLEAIDFLAETRPASPLGATGFGTVASIKTRLSWIMKGGRPKSLTRSGAAWITALAVTAIPLTWRESLDRGLPRGYRIVDLGPFDPVAINNAGQIVGRPLESRDRKRAYRWDRGRWSELAQSDDIFVTATDINDRGQVTGWYTVLLEPASKSITPSGPLEREAKYSAPHAFRTASNRPIDVLADDLGTLGGDESRGLAINDAGQVAGVSSLASTSIPLQQPTRAFRTAPEQPINPRTDLLEPFDAEQIDHSDWGVAMNNRGDVVVNTHFSERRPAFHAAPTGAFESVSVSLWPDDEPGTEVAIGDVNDQGIAVGYVESWGTARQQVPVSFALDLDRKINLETDRLPHSFNPKAINNNGLVVGAMESLPLQPYNRPAIYDNKRLHRLSELLPPESGWTLLLAVDINDRGQVIGTGLTRHLDYRGILLDPARSPARFCWLLCGTVLTGLGQAAGLVRAKHGRSKPMSAVSHH